MPKIASVATKPGTAKENPMEARPAHARYSKHDLIVDCITFVAAVVIVVAVLFQLGSI